MGTCCSKDSAETPASTRSNGKDFKKSGAADRRADKLKRYEASQQRQSAPRNEDEAGEHREGEDAVNRTTAAPPPRGVTHAVVAANDTANSTTIYDVQQIPASPVSKKDNSPRTPAAVPTPTDPISKPLALAASVLATTAEHAGVELETPAVLAATSSPADAAANSASPRAAQEVNVVPSPRVTVAASAKPADQATATTNSTTSAANVASVAVTSSERTQQGEAAAAVSPGVPPPAAAAPPSRVSNVLASLLPADDVGRDRRAREEMLNSQEVNKPKMIEFDVNFDDDDLIALEDMGDEGELVEDFTVEDESPSRGKEAPVDGGSDEGGGAANGVATPRKRIDNSGDGVSLFDGINKISGSGGATTNNGAEATPTKLDKKWFLDRGVVPPKSIVWKQDKHHVTIRIAPADESSGWELSKDGSILDFTSTAGGRNAKVVLALLHPLRNAQFDLNLMDCVLTFTGEKVPLRQSNDDDDDEDGGADGADVFPYWTQLIRGSRKDYGALTFISRDLEDDDDDAEPQYEYGKEGNVAAAALDDEAAFSAPEDD